MFTAKVKAAKSTKKSSHQGAVNELSGKNKPVGELFEVIQPIIQLKVSN